MSEQFENIEAADIKIIDSPAAQTEQPPVVIENKTDGETNDSSQEDHQDHDQRDNQGADDSDDGQGDDEGYEITEEIAQDIVSEMFGISADDIQNRLQRLEELENGEMQFKSPKHKQAYEFISQYGGDDFEAGIIRFARMSSMDVSNMAPEKAMRELFIQKNQDLSIEDANALFDSEYNQKYSDLEDEITKIRFNQEGRRASEELAQLKDKYTVKEEDHSDVEDHSAELAQVRQSYLSSVETTLEDFSSLTLSIDGEEGSEFNFEVSDLQTLKEGMSDYGAFYQNMEWVSPEGKWNHEKMSVDMAFLMNKEAMLEQYYKHGKTLGREQMLAEINNAPNKSKREAASTQRTGDLSQDERFSQMQIIKR